MVSLRYGIVRFWGQCLRHLDMAKVKMVKRRVGAKISGIYGVLRTPTPYGVSFITGGGVGAKICGIFGVIRTPTPYGVSFMTSI